MSQVRLPALVWGVASIPALYYFGRQIAHRREAFLATLFMVANYQHLAVWLGLKPRAQWASTIFMSGYFVQ